MVKVDVVNFQIGPDLENVETFVYTPQAACKSSCRRRQRRRSGRRFRQPRVEYCDLREELSRSMHDALNRSVNQYGVTIRNIRIT